MPTSKKVDVLIVDDSRTERFWQLKVMQGMGCHVETASDGNVGLKYLLQGGRADLVLLDLTMPRMSGMAFLKEVRKNQDLEHLKIIVLSSMEEDEVITSLEQGADDYWIKGSSILVLKKRISNLVHILRLERKLRLIGELVTEA